MNRARLALTAVACPLLLVLAGVLATGSRPDAYTLAPPAAEARSLQPPTSPPPCAPSAARAPPADSGAPARVETDRLTGGVRFAGRLDGFLTGPRAGDAADIALAYVRQRPPRVRPGPRGAREPPRWRTASAATA